MQAYVPTGKSPYSVCVGVGEVEIWLCIYHIYNMKKAWLCPFQFNGIAVCKYIHGLIKYMVQGFSKLTENLPCFKK